MSRPGITPHDRPQRARPTRCGSRLRAACRVVRGGRAGSPPCDRRAHRARHGADGEPAGSAGALCRPGAATDRGWIMSLDATRWAWMQQGLSAQQKLVLLALADRADERDICFPSVARLSGDTGLDRKTIMRAVASLEQAGIMEVVRSSGAGNRYRLVGVEHREDRGKAPTKTSAECGTSPVFG
ncbi:MAG TPA: hypothetical protein DDW98_11945, partial [Gammaproteobacteria bacterium]|nr:hypothetical protein [Gammaproteobacteria bacterium]